LRWLEPPIQSWHNQVHWDQLPWYGLEKARRGAFSTLLGVTFTLPEGEIHMARWQAIALGDTCLYQIRGEKVVVHWPIAQAADFGTAPALLSTRPEYNRRSLEELETREGVCRPGDLFVLATDALAAWFLERVESDERPWQRLTRLSEGRYARLVEHLRRGKAMRNDDVTLLLVWIESDSHERP
jgi:hypothetical protein